MQIQLQLVALASLILAPFSSAAPAAEAGAPSARLESALEKAVAAFEAGEYSVVLEVVAEAPEDAPEAAKLAYLAGETQLLLGNATEAESAFRRVLATRPEAVPAQVGLARALTSQGELEKARAILVETLKAEPKDLGAKTAMGRLLAREKKYDEALKELARATKLDPGNPFTARARVEVMLLADKAPKAASVSRAFVKARPEHPMGYFLLAVVLERDGEDREAIEQYQKALAKDPNFLDAHKNLAILCHTLSNTYQDKERTKLAFAHYERYFGLGGSDKDLRAMYDNLLRFKKQILGS